MSVNRFPKDYFPEHLHYSMTREELDYSLAKYKHHIIAFIKNLPQGASVLDAGCGSGKTIALLRAYRPDLSITAIDISDVGPMLPAEVSFKELSCEEAGEYFPENTFDAIICQHVIEHLISPIPTMRGFKVILKPGGKLFLETPNWTRLFIPFSHLFFWNDYTHVRAFSSFSMRKMFSEHGFFVEKLVTPSSNDFFVKRVKSKQISGNNIQNESPTQRLVFWKRVFNRVTNPLLKDLLIVIGRNEK